MFSAKTYTARRHELRTKIGSGIILLPGNSLSPNNYPNNAYYFRQDSSFRYYFGLNVPSVVGVIDADTGEEALYGDDFTVEDIIWTGPQPTLREMGAGAGVTATFPMAELEKRLRRAISLGRRVHYLPPYRGETKLQLSALLGIKPALLHDYKSVDLMFAVAEMREKKSAEEVEEMERAFRIGYEMHTTAMRMCRPGVVERQIAGAIEGVAKSQGQGVSFPSIVSQHGETLHNLNADGVLEEGRLLLTPMPLADTVYKKEYRKLYESLDYIRRDSAAFARFGVKDLDDLAAIFPEAMRDYVRWGYDWSCVDTCVDTNIIELEAPVNVRFEVNAEYPHYYTNLRNWYNDHSYDVSNDTLRLFLGEECAVYRISCRDLLERQLERSGFDPAEACEPAPEQLLRLLDYRDDRCRILFENIKLERTDSAVVIQGMAINAVLMR